MIACECCGVSLEGKRQGARYCSDRCRRAGWADRTGYRSGNGQERILGAPATTFRDWVVAITLLLLDGGARLLDWTARRLRGDVA